MDQLTWVGARDTCVSKKHPVYLDLLLVEQYFVVKGIELIPLWDVGRHFSLSWAQIKSV